MIRTFDIGCQVRVSKPFLTLITGRLSGWFRQRQGSGIFSDDSPTGLCRAVDFIVVQYFKIADGNPAWPCLNVIGKVYCSIPEKLTGFFSKTFDAVSVTSGTGVQPSSSGIPGDLVSSLPVIRSGSISAERSTQEEQLTVQEISFRLRLENSENGSFGQQPDEISN